MNFKFIAKEVILIYLITSVVVTLPNVNIIYFFYFKSACFFILSFLFLILMFNKNNRSFFLKNDGFLLALLIFIVVVYGIVVVSIFNMLLFSVWFILIFISFGRYIGVNDIKLGFFSTLSLLILMLLLMRVFLAAFIEEFNYVYFSKGLFLELKNVGYNLGRTGWAISLIFLISFLSGFKETLARNNFFLKKIVECVIFLSVACIFLSDSRTGMAALIFIIFIWNVDVLLKNIKNKILVLFAFIFEVLLFFFGGFLFLRSLLDGTRLNMLLSNNNDDVSNGRLDGVEIGFKIIKNNFFIGTQPDNKYSLIDYGLDYPEIHVTWLNLMALYGVPLITAVFVILMLIIKKSWLSFFKNKDSFSEIRFPILLFMVFFGLFTTFVEPNSIISFVSFVSIYWFVLGVFFVKRTVP